MADVEGGSIDAAAIAINDIFKRELGGDDPAPQPDPAPAPEPEHVPDAARLEGEDLPNTDEEAPQGDTPVEASQDAPEPQLKAEAPEPKQVPQAQPKAAPTTQQNNAAQQLHQLSQHINQLQAGLQVAFPDIKSLEDLKRLAVEDPARVIAFNAHERELQVARAYLPQVQAAAQAEWEQAETVKLHQLIPDLKDNAKGAALREKIAAYALEAGYSPQKLQTVSAVEVKALHDAMQYRSMKAQQDAEAKKQADAIVEARKKAADAPQVQKPGAQRPADSAADKAQELRARLRKTGDVDDAAKVFAQILG